MFFQISKFSRQKNICIKYLDFHAKNYIFKYIIFRTKIVDFRTFVQIQLLAHCVTVLFFIFRLWMATTEWSFW